MAKASSIQALLNLQVELPLEVEHAVEHATQQLQDLRQWVPPRHVSRLLPYLLRQHADSEFSSRLRTQGC